MLFHEANGDNCLARAKQERYPSGTRLQQQIVLLSCEGVIRTRENTTGLHKIFIFYHKLASQTVLWSRIVALPTPRTKDKLMPNVASSSLVMWDFTAIFLASGRSEVDNVRMPKGEIKCS
jgi:hypothetical protein